MNLIDQTPVRIFLLSINVLPAFQKSKIKLSMKFLLWQ